MGDQRTTVRNANHGPKVVGQDIMEESSTQKHRLGDRLVLGDRVFRYAKNGAVALVAAYHTMSDITLNLWTPYANYTQGCVILSTTGEAVGSADQYAEGYIVIKQGGGVGNAYKIKNNSATVGGVTKWTLYEPIQTDLSLTTTTGLSATSRYSGVLVGTTSITPFDPIGVPLVSVSASSCFWAQTWGPCPAMIGGSTIGATNNQMMLSNDTATAGAFGIAIVNTTGSGLASSGSGISTVFATSYLVRTQSATTAKVNIVNLRIEP